MVDVIHFYVDDSGTRRPDHHPGRKPAHGYDWFGLGGLLIKQDDEGAVRAAHHQFCASWPISTFLRSADIRSMADGFNWLRARSPEDRDRFFEQLYQLMAMPQLLDMACVIDRPGYNNR